MKKQYFAVCLSLLLALALIGCSSNNAAPNQSAETLPVAQATQVTQPTEQTEPTTPPDPIDLLTDQQRNALAMYNHLAVVTQEINDSKDGRMFLEEAYNALFENTNPESIDDRTRAYLLELLDVIEDYRFNDVKRERIQYIYEENKANMIIQAVPHTASTVASAAVSSVVNQNPVTLAKAAISSAGEYYNVHLLEQEYLKDGWELDDEQKKILHESRKGIFQYLLDVVQTEEIPGDMVLSEAAVKDFVKWSSEDNVHQRIRFFETEVATYKYYAGYWQELASCYYEVGDYEKCLRAMDEYEHIREELFLKDSAFAQTIPMAVVSAHELLDTETYIPVAERYLELLTNNALNTDWSVRYFAAQMYIDLYNKVGDEDYLHKALEIEIDNVNHLIQEQRKMNSNYMNGINVVEETGETEGSKTNLIEDFKKYLNNRREVELPPIYEPLTINCDLLFALAEELDITQEKQQEIEGILRGNGDPLFLSEALESQYSFGDGELFFTAQFKKDSLILPVSCVSENSIIRVSATTDGVTTVYEDWVVKKVERPSEDFASFIVTYASETIKEQVWNGNSTVNVEIIVDATYPDNAVEISFTVSSYVNLWVIYDNVEFVQAEK